jgi:hypothetical protein
MVSRALSVGIVAFWLVMMGALIRVEFYSKPQRLETMPISRVLRKVFNNAEPARLHVYRDQERIGTCTLDITPLASLDARPADPITNASLGAYRVQAGFFPLESSGPKLRADVWCDSQYDVQKFVLKTSWGGMQLKASGDNRTEQVDLLFEDGEVRQERHFKLGEIRSRGLSEALGVSLPGAAGLLGMAGLPAATVGSDPAAGGIPRPTTVVYYGRVPINDLPEMAYGVEVSFNEGLRGRIWVDKSGQILLVETSLGFTMRTASLDTLDRDSPRTREAAPQ